MKRMKRMMIMLVMALVMFSGSAFALDTATVTVNAEVLASCTFDTGTLALDFGTLDPDLGTAANATGGLDFTCNAGTTYNLTTAPGGVITDAVSADTIAYTTTLGGATTGTSAGATHTVTVDTDIAAGGFLGKTAGIYAGSFTVDLNL